ncbi:S9 family peptidase [Acuticoccus sp. I52.16.1]|uniref:alpha/beta hydrolase family protein n=1 Tax=Acuticoccus sp. I52.16.1 TaxID=2928472 RepID=UPI001FD61E54|nr:alpha/beta fold hydrolase [Acuticoccus sp. I52.16.1]UOM35494.1 alpha/beta hydrolase [Acuticoccus sp. I52.16.1]
MRRAAILCAALIVVAGIVPAAAQRLPPQKDDRFAYPGVLVSEDGGAYRVIDYDEMRDVNRRDAVPERRVHSQYISLGIRRNQADILARTDAGDVMHVAVGRRTGSKLIVIYIHGQGGSRKQGVDDLMFGGNFNRIKNMVAAAGGVYLSPDFANFGAKGAAQVAALIKVYRATAPNAPVFVACGSMGGAICWLLSRDPAVAPMLGGLLLLGSFPDPDFTESPAFRDRVPILLAQGSADPVMPVAKTEAFYRSIRAAAPDYPVRMLRFETGKHGTPIRMTDWRETINWMLSAK